MPVSVRELFETDDPNFPLVVRAAVDHTIAARNQIALEAQNGQ